MFRIEKYGYQIMSIAVFIQHSHLYEKMIGVQRVLLLSNIL